MRCWPPGWAIEVRTLKLGGTERTVFATGRLGTGPGGTWYLRPTVHDG